MEQCLWRSLEAKCIARELGAAVGSMQRPHDVTNVGFPTFEGVVTTVTMVTTVTPTPCLCKSGVVCETRTAT